MNDDEWAIRTRGLTKHYGPDTGVFGLDLRVGRGEVYGFLGPNGSGKTTTMRMLVGLVRPTSGEAVVVGHPPGSSAGLSRIGALIESPALYPHLSGRDNLRLLARYAGVPASRVDDVLDEVEMTDRADRPFRSFSLGMRQRTAVAAALLKDPDLLILDEPTNGLDPAGVVGMRELVGRLRSAHRTVLLSSHVLAEVEQLCDRVGVIRRGRLVAEGTVQELRDRTAGGGLEITAADPARAEELLRTLPEVRDVTRDAHGLLHVAADPQSSAAVNRALVTGGVEVAELRRVRVSLEDAFFELTAEPSEAAETSDVQTRNEVTA
jgi:ABC-2 type transport system ATP-binding protein